jgi:hypothetical protein
MASVETLIAELKTLSPDQLERVAQMVHTLSEKGSQNESLGPSILSKPLLEQAIANGWPAELFSKIIGNIGDDFERPAQPPFEVRATR